MLFSSINCIEHTQNERGEATKGWAIFGIISCVYDNLLLVFFSIMSKIVPWHLQDLLHYLPSHSLQAIVSVLNLSV